MCNTVLSIFQGLFIWSWIASSTSLSMGFSLRMGFFDHPIPRVRCLWRRLGAGPLQKTFANKNIVCSHESFQWLAEVISINMIDRHGSQMTQWVYRMATFYQQMLRHCRKRPHLPHRGNWKSSPLAFSEPACLTGHPTFYCHDQGCRNWGGGAATPVALYQEWQGGQRCPFNLNDCLGEIVNCQKC
jgi:hypothetical protein